MGNELSSELPEDLATVDSREIIHQEDDQLLILDVGAVTVDLTQNLHCIGKEWTPLIRSHIF